MDRDMLEMFQLVIDKIDGLDRKIDEEIRGVKIMIETDVTKKIESLFDGYQLNHERQWELQRKVEELEKRLERLESLAG